MAMGASATDVQRMVLRNRMRPIGLGLSIGLAAGLILSLLMSKMSQALNFIDAPVLVAISLILITVAGVAAYLPTRRATHIDPWTALRSQ
jgi:ABC-type antimicrobial peptide transport system permease subunit